MRSLVLPILGRWDSLKFNRLKISKNSIKKAVPSLVTLLTLVFLTVLSGTTLGGCVEQRENNLSKGKNDNVPPAPASMYLSLGESKQLSYWNHTITVSFTSSNMDRVIIVTVDEQSKTFIKNVSDNPRGIYWEENNLNFEIKPVLWEVRDNKEIPIYEKTWNTSEIYFEVYLSEVR
jgi:hypothetical protein